MENNKKAMVENIAKVAYVWGCLESEGLLNDRYDDLEEICIFWEEVASDWEHVRDCKTFEEEGYITAYAERVLIEKYGK
ncbi:hypothetical protein vBBceHLY2_00119 [Bacillus phage vB_BceH_LY2]|nr:hypothetical protein vBBceHLY2_00119 [Bacillus phage vB_BceH_LY2]